jgi:hypothetical protein
VRNFAYNPNRRAAEARASWETAKPKSPTPNWTIGALSAATSPPLTKARNRRSGAFLAVLASLELPAGCDVA